MKSIHHFFVFFLALALVSCQFTEEITIHKNGSGTYKLNVDMGSMMSSMSGMSKNDSIKKEPEKIDSIIYIKDILEAKKDSIAQLSDADKAMVDAVKDMKMRIQVNEEKGVMLMDFMIDFKNISEIDDIKKKLEKAQQLQENKGKEKQDIENHEIHYSYNRNKFKRSVIMKELSDEEQEKFDETQNKNNMFLSGSKYKLIYNFPKKIKKVSYPNAQFSDNRKSLIIEVEMDSLTKNPQLLDFEVTF
jgi:hypothetical protein